MGKKIYKKAIEINGEMTVGAITGVEEDYNVPRMDFCDLSDAIKLDVIACSCYFANYESREDRKDAGYNYGMIYTFDCNEYRLRNTEHDPYKTDYNYVGSRINNDNINKRRSDPDKYFWDYDTGWIYLYKNQAEGVCTEYSYYEDLVFNTLGMESYVCSSVYMGETDWMHHAWASVRIKDRRGNDTWVPFDYGIGASVGTLDLPKSDLEKLDTEKEAYSIYLYPVQQYGAPDRKSFNEYTFDFETWYGN